MPAIRPLKLIHELARRVALALLLIIAASAPARPNGCPQLGKLGTARILAVDPAMYPRVGLKSFPKSLPLRDHEVVLTFDDGPLPATTPRVLAALAQECVRATFFLIGRPAFERPDLVRRIAAGGHTIGHHTWLHRSLMRIKPSEARDEIDHGIAAVEEALHGTATTVPTTPFFRYPGFESTPASLESLRSRGIAVFGTDLWASDWKSMTPQQELNLLIGQLNVARRGIILLHDNRVHTAAMMPAFLRYLRQNGYRVVHLVAKTESVDYSDPR